MLKDIISIIIFRLETKAEQQKYGDVILDFTYFKAAEGFNKKIDNSSVSILLMTLISIVT